MGKGNKKQKKDQKKAPAGQPQKKSNDTNYGSDSKFPAKPTPVGKNKKK